MALSTHIHVILLVIFVSHHQNTLTSATDSSEWTLLLSNIGISAMHMQLLHNDKVVIYDRTGVGASNISLPNGKWRIYPNDTALHKDCTAHSVEYDVALNSVRPLMVTDIWCSSGAVLQDGSLAQTGGFNDGIHDVRLYTPCNDDACNWMEFPHVLTEKRNYATNHILPDGGQIIVGGRGQFTYEFFPKSFGPGDKSYKLPFLEETHDTWENNLYPFVFLNGDGRLFIFANNRAVLLDYKSDMVIRRYPRIPGGDPRNFPSSGSAVLLPLKNDLGHEVMVCGGAPEGAFESGNQYNYVPALNICGRIRINAINPQWVMEAMPMGRVMGDMVLLPNGKVLIINGAGSGTADWDRGLDPVLSPVIYRPDNLIGSRFEVQNPSSKPRLYASTALLLRDGRVLVGGSNPHLYYTFTGVDFPTDLSLESFSPYYLDMVSSYIRPEIILHMTQTRIGYGQQIPIRFTIPPGRLNGTSIMVTMVAPSFVTHSFSMNQRLLVLSRGSVKSVARSTYQVRVATPKSGKLAPPGYYLLFVVHKDIPSEGIWVQIN